MSLIISIECQSGNAGGEQREARVETTATGVKWTISGKLETAIRELFAGIGDRHAFNAHPDDFNKGYQGAAKNIAYEARHGLKAE